MPKPAKSPAMLVPASSARTGTAPGEAGVCCHWNKGTRGGCPDVTLQVLCQQRALRGCPSTSAGRAAGGSTAGPAAHRSKSHSACFSAGLARSTLSAASSSHPTHQASNAAQKPSLSVQHAPASTQSWLCKFPACHRVPGVPHPAMGSCHCPACPDFSKICGHSRRAAGQEVKADAEPQCSQPGPSRDPAVLRCSPPTGRVCCQPFSRRI